MMASKSIHPAWVPFEGDASCGRLSRQRGLVVHIAVAFDEANVYMGLRTKKRADNYSFRHTCLGTIERREILGEKGGAQGRDSNLRPSRTLLKR